jgi:hypothetical protein
MAMLQSVEPLMYQGRGLGATQGTRQEENKRHSMWVDKVRVMQQMAERWLLLITETVGVAVGTQPMTFGPRETVAAAEAMVLQVQMVI